MRNGQGGERARKSLLKRNPVKGKSQLVLIPQIFQLDLWAGLETHERGPTDLDVKLWVNADPGGIFSSFQLIRDSADFLRRLASVLAKANASYLTIKPDSGLWTPPLTSPFLPELLLSLWLNGPINLLQLL